MKTKYVEWVEPFDAEAKYTLICRMSVEEVIKYQKNRQDIIDKGFKYADDETALMDFVVIHWGKIIELD